MFYWLFQLGCLYLYPTVPVEKNLQVPTLVLPLTSWNCLICHPIIYYFICLFIYLFVDVFFFFFFWFICFLFLVVICALLPYFCLLFLVVTMVGYMIWYDMIVVLPGHFLYYFVFLSNLFCNSKVAYNYICFILRKGKDYQCNSFIPEFLKWTCLFSDQNHCF